MSLVNSPFQSQSAPRFFSAVQYYPEKKSKKPVIIIAVSVLAIVTVGVAVLFFTRQDKPTVTQDAQPLVEDFYGKYQTLLTTYESFVGFNREALQQQVADSDDVFPILIADIEEIGASLSQTEAALKGLDGITMPINGLSDEENANFTTAKSVVTTAITDIKSNMDLISNIYDAFISPLYFAAMSGDVPADCVENDARRSLLESSDKSVTEVAKLYNQVYCMGLDTLADKTGVDDALRQKLVSAGESLVSLLKPLDESATGVELFANVEKALEKK